MSITVILNGYKRPHVLQKQLESIKNQSVQTDSIVFWQNSGSQFDENLTKDLVHASCNNNLGVWARFAFALNANT